MYTKHRMRLRNTREKGIGNESETFFLENLVDRTIGNEQSFYGDRMALTLQVRRFNCCAIVQINQSDPFSTPPPPHLPALHTNPLS